MNKLEPKIPKKRGGRKPGQTNLETRRKAALQSEAVKLLASTLHPDAIKAMSPLDVLLACMQVAFQAGDLDRARICASEAAPYLHSRRSPDPAPVEVPPELISNNGISGNDPAPEPDEPGPQEPIT